MVVDRHGTDVVARPDAPHCRARARSAQLMVTHGFLRHIHQMPHRDPAAHAAYHTRYRAEHKAEAAAHGKKWRLEHPERSRELARKRMLRWRQTEKGKGAEAAYKARDPEGYRIMKNEATARWRAKYPDKAKASDREQNRRPAKRAAMTADWKRRYERSPTFRIAQNIRSRINMALRNTGSLKAEHSLNLIGCTPVELKAYIESKFLPGMSWENRRQWHIDHITPCAAFDLVDPEQQRLCFHFTNLQPLWAIDNLSKGKKR
jgi:hypothetical protein